MRPRGVRSVAPDRHEWLGLPDGGVADVPFDELVTAVVGILEEEDPAIVVTFGPDGIFGHPDHIAIGAATDQAFARLRSLDRSGFQRLAHGAVPQTVFERWNRQRAELGLYVFDPTQTYHMRGVPDEQIRITVDAKTSRRTSSPDSGSTRASCTSCPTTPRTSFSGSDASGGSGTRLRGLSTNAMHRC
jgi:LmbE family N-acetylglucosaminyl deacetylase